jgi:hypothetical protein
MGNETYPTPYKFTILSHKNKHFLKEIARTPFLSVPAQFFHIKKPASDRKLVWLNICTAAFAVILDKKVLNHHSSKWVFAETILPVLFVV